MEEKKIKKGDKVKCVEGSARLGLVTGDIYTVHSWWTGNGCYIEELDDRWRPNKTRFVAVDEVNLREEVFKVGDRVECIESNSNVREGKICTVGEGDQDHGLVQIVGIGPCFKRRFKLANKQTIKQEGKNMTLNSSIRKVFVEEDKAGFDLVEKMQSNFGSQINENFTGEMLLRNNKDEYIAEIKRIDDEAEKAAKEAAKKAKA